MQKLLILLSSTFFLLVWGSNLNAGTFFKSESSTPLQETQLPENDSSTTKYNDSSPKQWIEPTAKMVFIWIPGSCYNMGNPLSKEHWREDEGPPHEVCVDGFWMGKYEVTRAQFDSFIKATGYKTDAEKQGWSLEYNGKWKKIQNVSWKNPGFNQTETHPVVHISKVDAKSMARWLSSQGNGLFRLPTEAEWEYSCHAGVNLFRPWGDNLEKSYLFANLYDQTGKKQNNYPWEPLPCDDKAAETAPIGSYEANEFGLNDMLGNVWEWTEDRHGWYDVNKKNNPIATQGDGYVIRGGAWNSGSDTSCVRRENLGLETIRANNLGFRLVRKEKN